MDYSGSYDERVLRLLSSDSRASLTELASVMGCSRVTAKRELERIGGKYGIRYTLELDEGVVGVSERHVILIKFGKRPDAEALAGILNGEEYVQEAFATQGDFDLLIFARATDPISYVSWETHLASLLSDYKPLLRPSEFVVAHFGYLPVNNDIIEQIHARGVAKLDKALLKALNGNSRLSYTELAEMTGAKAGSVRYHVHMLHKSGIIKRFTIAAQDPHMDYKLAFFVNYRFNSTTKVRSALARKSYFDSDDGTAPLNNFQLLAPLSGSYRFFVMGAFADEKEAREKALDAHRRIFHAESIELVHARITSVVKGLLPFRNLSIRDNYVVINWK